MSTAILPALPESCDIMVVGGAMVGGTLALALAQQGFHVVLLDSRPLNDNESAPTDLIDRRTTAMAAATTTILNSWGLWSGIEASSCAIKSVHVSQRGRFGALRMHADELQVPALGHVVDNTQYNTQLAGKLAEQPNVTVIAPADINEWVQCGSSVTLQLTFNGTAGTVTAPLLIAADGVHSAIRAKAGISVTETDYQQYALTASVETELATQHIAYERFTSSGPLAMLPVSDHISSCICTVDESQVEQYQSAQSAQRTKIFLSHVQQQFGQRLGRLSRCSEPEFYPLILRTARQSHSGRTLLLGNALRTLHPVAGQGFNLAIRDVGKLIQLLSDPSAAEDPGAESVLTTLAAARSKDQVVTVGATDLLARLFRGENKSLSHIRALGILGIDTLPPLKRAFARRAMGYGVPLPDLNYQRQ